MPNHEGEYQRDILIQREQVNEEDRTVEVAFSSESPVERWWGTEILDHAPGSVRLDRLQRNGAVLVDHNPGDHVGVVESVRIDDDRKGRATLRFGRGVRASEIFNDIQDGIRTLISVGYRVHKFLVDEDEDEERAIDWEPYEISLVAIPADTTVGVGRSSETGEDNTMPDTKKTETKQEPQTSDINIKAEVERSRKEERERMSAILALGETHDAAEEARQYIEEGKSIADFQQKVLELIGERNVKARSEQAQRKIDAGRGGTLPCSDDLGLSEQEKQRYSLLRAMAAVALPNERKVQEAAAFEIEVGLAAAEKIGIQSRGIFIPNDIMTYERALSAGGATAGAELVATNLLAGSFIETLRNRLVTAQAGATMLTGLVGNVDIPRQTAGAQATWISAEDGDATEDEAAFDQVSLTPKDLACYTETTRRLLMQSTPSADMLVRDDLANAQAIGLDAAVLYGSGAAGQPVGIVNQTGVNGFNFAAANPTYAETVRMIREVMTGNALRGALSYIIDPAGWEAAMTTEKAANTAQFILSDAGTINGYPQQTSNQVATEDWFFGNWRDALIGLWGGVELNVDPYTHSLKGRIRFVTFQTADVAIRHPESFCYCNDGA